MLSRFKLGTQLMVAFMLIGLLPLFLGGYITYNKAKDSLSHAIFQQLVSLRDIKKFQIEELFAERQSDTDVLATIVANLNQQAVSRLTAIRGGRKQAIETYFAQQMALISDVERNIRFTRSVQPLQEVFGRGVKSQVYYDVYNQYYPALKKYMENYGFEDLFLISLQGDVLFTVNKKGDLGENLLHGSLQKSGLAEAFQQGREKPVMVDFQWYEPTQMPAAFFAVPLRDEKNAVMAVAAFQVSSAPINTIMTHREGLGKTGETILIGPDKLMRSDSYLDPENHSVVNSFRHPDKGQVDTIAVRNALEGHEGHAILRDYKQNLAVVTWSPIQIAGVTWALISKMGLEEAFVPHIQGRKRDFYAEYVEKYGYYDLFLVEPEGYVFYTVAHEADYQSNMVSGQYRDSNFGKLIRQVLETKKFAFADFAPYAPSKNEPAAFIAQPVLNASGEVDLVVALQISLESIDSIMQQRSGMGKTGETYLVGADKRMRSDSYLDSKGHSVVASFAGTIEKNGVDTEASRLALADKEGAKIIIDYNGNPVLSAYTHIHLGGILWALLAEIDVAEAFEPVITMRNRMLAIGLGALVIVILFAIRMSRSITYPIQQTVTMAHYIENGNLTHDIEISRKDEIGEMATAMQVMNRRLREIVTHIQSASYNVVNGAAEIAKGNMNLSQRTEEQAASLEETASSMEELTSTVKQNSASADQVNQLALQTYESAQVGVEVVNKAIHAMLEITHDSSKITDIINVIDEIAFQTNLLALNASVEAARAGDQGRGFSVVASEVRKLAQRSAGAAKEIKLLIHNNVRKVEEGSQLVDHTGRALQGILLSVKKVSDTIGDISAASKEQSSGIDQINKAVMQLDDATQQNAALVEEIAAAAKSLDEQATAMKEELGFFQING